MDVPYNPTVDPKGYRTRSAGGNIDPGAKIVQPPKQANVRYVTHVVLYDTRIWTSAQGKPLEAKLIAFEDLIVEGPKGGAQPVAPNPPAKPTVVRQGKVRLLVNNKPVAVGLDTLSEGDQDFVRDIQTAVDKKAAAAK